MDTSKQQPVRAVNRSKIKEETTLVLEAFLKRSLSQDEGSRIGHVGRTYHDPTKYSHRPSKDGHRHSSLKHTIRPSEKKGSKPPNAEKDEVGTNGKHGSWNSLCEDINRVEEKKHGFKTSMKQLLRRHSQTKEKGDTLKNKSATTSNRSADSLDGALEEPRGASGPSDSLKRPKTPNALLACALATPEHMDGEDDSMYVPAVEKHSPVVEKSSSQGARRKCSNPFSLKKFLKKKSSMKDMDRDRHKGEPGSHRPNTLPLTPCYVPDPGQPNGMIGVAGDDPGIYTKAAKQLDRLVRQQKVRSPTADFDHTVLRLKGLDTSSNGVENHITQKTELENDKEAVVQRLVTLLQEQAVVINQQIEDDPVLRGALSRMSYRSFSHLADLFTSQAEVIVPEKLAVSPELTKIALTMELTRKVAGINSHAVQTLMGYSTQYMDMFVPWLQKQGGWVSMELMHEKQVLLIELTGSVGGLDMQHMRGKRAADKGDLYCRPWDVSLQARPCWYRASHVRRMTSTGMGMDSTNRGDEWLRWIHLNLLMRSFQIGCTSMGAGHYKHGMQAAKHRRRATQVLETSSKSNG